MKVIAQKIWQEPACAVGALVSLALLALAFLTDTNWDASVIAGIVAPLVSSLGIRQLVTPADTGAPPIPTLSAEETTHDG